MLTDHNKILYHSTYVHNECLRHHYNAKHLWYGYIYIWLDSYCFQQKCPIKSETLVLNHFDFLYVYFVYIESSKSAFKHIYTHNVWKFTILFTVESQYPEIWIFGFWFLCIVFYWFQWLWLQYKWTTILKPKINIQNTSE